MVWMTILKNKYIHQYIMNMDVLVEINITPYVFPVGRSTIVTTIKVHERYVSAK